MVHKFILFITFIFPLSTFAQNNGNIAIGSSITATANSNPWLSPSGDFAFGFQQLQNHTDLYVLSIWFNRIPDRTIVWFERSSYPVSRGSTLQLDSARGFLLRDSTERVLWNTDFIDAEVAYGFINDTGNLILSGRSSIRLWESFRHPADTILPTQTIELGDMLFSRKTVTNFSEGRFNARMNGDNGNFLLETRAVHTSSYVEVEYYSSDTSGVNASHYGYQVLFNERGLISVRRRNGEQVDLSSRSNPPTSDNYYRATLDISGVFTQYYHPRNFSGNPGWTIAGSWPENICQSAGGSTGSGACGYNSICRLQNQRPMCQCLQGFSLVDPNNPYGDCMQRLVQHCVVGENGSTFEIISLPDVSFPYGDYEQINPISEEDCRNRCLSDCFCGLATYWGNTCRKKRIPVTNGYINTSLNITTFLKLRTGDISLTPPNPQTSRQPTRERRTLIRVVSVLLGSSVFINFLLLTAACFVCSLIYRKKISFSNSLQTSPEGNLRCFTYKELLQATNGFKEELGKGAFGIVYKGVVQDVSKRVVAVKKLDRVSEDSEKEFKMEVSAIGHTHHRNLVRLIGYCDEGTNRLLVYEYMGNGTLAEFLFGDSKPKWSLRCLMALGVARGLTYLHEECTTQIIHCDIKPQNILVDEHYNARISDFGLAKLLRLNQTRTHTNIRGTKGYVAPEWFRNTPITAKVDVYSFGVLLLEIISCSKNIRNRVNSEDEENQILTDWVWDCFQENRLDCLVDYDMEALSDKRKLERFVMVGIWCIQEEASLRPTMRKAIHMLEGIVDVSVPPCPFSFST